MQREHIKLLLSEEAKTSDHKALSDRGYGFVSSRDGCDER
jgi:hypothetical protein